MPDPTIIDQAPWLHGRPEACNLSPAKRDRALRLVLLGAPGIGKGTQAELLRQRTGACQLSTGEVFRAAKKLPPEMQSPAIREAIDYMNAGNLVPDATVIALVRERSHCLRCPCGFLLDGFPRTVPQAEALEQMLETEGLKIDFVISYELPVERVVERIAGRRVCSTCKHSYHVKDLPPRKEGQCDLCGGELIQRVDDQPEAVRIRLAAYHKSTAPLIDYYSRKGHLLRVDCGHTPQETYQATLEALGLV